MSKDTAELMENKRLFYAGFQNKFFQYAFGTLLVLLIIFLIYQVGFLIQPIFDFISSLFAPIVISFLFYYILRPIIYKLEELHIPRVWGVLLVYLIGTILLVVFFAYLGPILAEQVRAIASTSVEALEKVRGSSGDVTIGPFTFNIENEIRQRIVGFLQQATVLLSQTVVDILSTVTRIATILLVIPFIVFYLLKDDHEFAQEFLNHFSGDFGKELAKILKNIDNTLSSYITGLVLVSLSVGGMLFIGYLIIGLKYALILSIIALVLMTVPALGPLLAVTPAILVGFSQGSFMLVKVLIVFLIVQQIESNFISPQIIGQRLKIYPLTLILLLLAAGTLYGLVGLILVTPVYAISKTILENLYKIYRLRYPRQHKELSLS